jgi:hypothetical protein
MVLTELVASLVGSIFGEGVLSAVGERVSKRPFHNGVIRCGLRAAEGRVYDMGTEWSTGLATITHARISFEPSTGVVGKRDIDVDLVATAEFAISGRDRSNPNSTVLLLVTPKGNLEWSIDTNQLKRAAELLSGASPAV